MPRFTDQWVMDRVLFDYMSGGSCACCGIAYNTLFGSTSDFITAASDLDDVAVTNETNALESWPEDLRDQVWADRIKLRQKLKVSRTKFRSNIAVCLKETPPLEFPLRLSKEAFLEVLKDQYKMHSCYVAVLECVLEQIANFSLTKYDPDGVEEDELAFEATLGFDGSVFTFSDENVFRQRCEGMTQGKLLPTKSLAGKIPLSTTSEKKTPSFASDRRIIRLILARYWADQWIQQLNKPYEVISS